MNSFQDNIFSIETLGNSIRSDWQIQRWFLCLIFSPKVRQLLETTEQARKHYALLQNCFFYSHCLYIVLLLASVLLIVTGQYLWLIFIVLSLIGLNGLFRLGRNAVVVLSLNLVNEDKPPQGLESSTLYQLGEYYGDKYKVPSLIDVIFAQDSLQRKAVLLTIILAFLYKIPVILFSLFLAWVVIFVINWPFIYKKLHRIVD